MSVSENSHEVFSHFSMPAEWAYILTCDKVTDKATTFNLLKYEWTVDDVFDFMEIIDVLKYYQEKEMESHPDNNQNMYGNRRLM